MRITTWLLAAALAAFAGGATAQTFPRQPLRVIVPVAAGSVTDVIMRAAARDLAPRLGQPLVVENRTGASGIIAAQACARSPADGHTLCVINNNTTSFNPLLFDRLPYDVEGDFAPVANLFQLTEVLVVPATLPVRSAAELRRFATTDARGVGFGTLGANSVPELFMAWLNGHWGVSMTSIPYGGGGPIALALSTGEVQASSMGLGNFLPLIQAGSLRPLAVSAEQRSPLLPEVPTFKEVGLEGFPVHVWWGVTTNRGSPPSAIIRLNEEFNRLFAEPDFAAFLARNAVEPRLGTPDAFATFLRQDRQAAEAVLRASGTPVVRQEFRAPN